MHLKRGSESWTYVHVVFGFALSIEGTFVSMSPLQWPTNAFFALGLFALTFLIFFKSAWFQNRLIGLKEKIEDRWNDPRFL